MYPGKLPIAIASYQGRNVAHFFARQSACPAASVTSDLDAAARQAILARIALGPEQNGFISNKSYTNTFTKQYTFPSHLLHLISLTLRHLGHVLQICKFCTLPSCSLNKGDKDVHDFVSTGI